MWLFFCLFIFLWTLSFRCVHALLTLITFKNQMVPSLVFCFTLSTKWWHISVFKLQSHMSKHFFPDPPRSFLPFPSTNIPSLSNPKIAYPSQRPLGVKCGTYISSLSSLRILRSCSMRSQIRWPSRKQGWLVCRNPHYRYNMRRSHSKAKTRVDYVCIYSSRRSFFWKSH